MTAAALTAAFLAVGVILGWVRLGLWQTRAPIDARLWRLALLTIAQPVVALILYLTLFPPPRPTTSSATLTVLTRDAGAAPTGAVALPETGRRPGEAAPDLATALRHHPGATRLRVLGQGLEARDVNAANGLDLAFDPPPLPRGLIALAAPGVPLAPGAGFDVGGQASGLAGGSAALIDPAGQEVARVPLSSEGGFVLRGSVRTAGVALFRIRLRDTGRAIVEEADAPVWAAPLPPTRVLFLAGAPGPEVKYWRRWAQDAGLAVTMRVALGAGLALGDPGPALSPGTLARYDLIVVDDRSWNGLSSAERSALNSAVRSGAGLLLRTTAPLQQSLRDVWNAWGMPLLAGTATAPVSLPPDADGDLPTLTRRTVITFNPATSILTRDRTNAPLVAWKSLGLGRIGVWTLADAASLVTAGHGTWFDGTWAQTTSTLARPQPADPAMPSPLPMAGEQMAVCGVTLGARMIDDRGSTTLLTDPAADGCGAYWPGRPGWHLLRRSGLPDRPIYVREAGALPGVTAATRGERTLRLAGTANPSVAVSRSAYPRQSGPTWPWLLLTLIALAALWWFERAKLGRVCG